MPFTSFFLIALATSEEAASFQWPFALNAELWPRWAEHDESSSQTIDHTAWSALLARYRQVGDDGIARAIL